MIKIVNAVSNERGTSKGGIKGDQTGKEIRVQNWYDRPWDYYLEPLDKSLAQRAAEEAERIANDDSYGYDQEDRWSGLKNDSGDFDCSSLCISAYILAGLNIPKKGYSGDMVERLCDTGKFVAHSDDEYLHSCDLAENGGIYVAEHKHAVICVGGEPKENKEREERFELKALGSVRVRKSPIDGKTVRILHKNERVGIRGVHACGWYLVDGGYVTNNPRYVEVLR